MCQTDSKFRNFLLLNYQILAAINLLLSTINGTTKNKLCQIVGAGLPRPYNLRIW